MERIVVRHHRAPTSKGARRHRRRNVLHGGRSRRHRRVYSHICEWRRRRLLTQVEAFVSGSSKGEIAQLETVARDIGDDFARRFETAKRTRAGAKGTFAIAQKWLTDEALLSGEGEWVDEAAKLLVSGS